MNKFCEMYSMSWKIWKESHERAQEEWNKAYEKGVNQKNWKEAINHFKSAASLFGKSKDPNAKIEANKSIALAWLYTALLSPTIENLLACSKAMDAIGDQTLKIPYDAKASDIAIETRVLAREKELNQKRSQTKTKEEIKKLAEEFEKLSYEFMNLQRDFVINTLFELKINGFSKGQKMLAISRFLLGLLEEDNNPTKALEYYSEALGYSKSISEDVEVINKRIKAMSIVAKCWFCGREIQGENVHFVYLPASFTPYIYNKFSADKPHTFSNGAIVACQTCYSALSDLSDKIAQEYYKQAVALIQNAVKTLQAQIDELVRQIRMLRLRIV